MNLKEVRLLFVMELLSGLARGAFLICIGWSTLIVSNDVAVVGVIFTVGNITSIIVGPVIGVAIDRYKRKKIIILAQIFIAACVAYIGYLMFNTDGLIHVSWLFIVMIIITSARLMYRVAFDGILRGSVEDKDIMQTMARAQTLHLLSTVISTASMGIIISEFSMSSGFFVSVIPSIFLLFVAVFLDDSYIKSSIDGVSGYWVDFKNGLVIFRSNPFLFRLVLLAMSVLPIGFLTSALLSAFVLDDLNKGSDVFGLVEATWQIGGMLAAGLLSAKIRLFRGQYIIYAIGLLSGISTIILSNSTNSYSLALSHGLMGFFGYIALIMIKAKISELSNTKNIGRSIANLSVMINLSGVIMCLSPSFIEFNKTATYFLYWGGFMVAAVILLFVWEFKVVSKSNGITS